jgi:hypothetical protein
MPAEEFILHKEFFDKYKWGVESDMLAQIFSQVLGSRIQKPIKTEPYEWKNLAFYKSGEVKKKAQDATSMRDAFMLMARSIGKEVKPNGEHK